MNLYLFDEQAAALERELTSIMANRRPSWPLLKKACYSDLPLIEQIKKSGIVMDNVIVNWVIELQGSAIDLENCASTFERGTDIRVERVRSNDLRTRYYLHSSEFNGVLDTQIHAVSATIIARMNEAITSGRPVMMLGPPITVREDGSLVPMTVVTATSALSTEHLAHIATTSSASIEIVVPLFVPPTFNNQRKIPLPKLLYHYTTQNGLLGIITTGELWATKIDYLNDLTEFHIAPELAVERLRLIETNPLDERQKEAAIALSRAIGLIEVPALCTICFCSNGDLLSQWRGYSGGSYGFSIGFDLTILRSVGSRCGFDLQRCIYKKAVQSQIIKELCENYLSDEILNSYELSDIVRDFARALRMFGAFFKHPAFSEEEEWRLVSIPPIRNDQLLFREGKSLITPYGTMTIGQGAISHVYVGPCPHMELSMSSVRTLLSKHRAFSPSGIGRVDPSLIPFRHW